MKKIRACHKFCEPLTIRADTATRPKRILQRKDAPRKESAQHRVQGSDDPPHMITGPPDDVNPEPRPLNPAVLPFAVHYLETPMYVRACSKKSFLPALFLLLASGIFAFAQADYPFRDPKLSDDQRIADLLGRLTLDEKVNLMSNHPKIPRLESGLLRPGGRAARAGAGRPRRMGSARQTAAAYHHLSAGEGARRYLGPDLMKKIGALEGQEARYYYQNPVVRLRRRGGARAQCRPQPRSALGPHRRVHGRRSLTWSER